MAEPESIAQQVEAALRHSLVRAEAQIQAWHVEREALLTRAQDRFANVGVEINHVWDGPGQPLQETRTAKDLAGTLQDFTRALDMTQEDRVWRDTEQSPAYQRYMTERDNPAVDAAIARAEDPAYHGWIAEQRYNESIGEPFDTSYDAFRAAGQDDEVMDAAEGEPEADLGGYVLPGTQVDSPRGDQSLTERLEALQQQLESLSADTHRAHGMSY